MSEPVDTRLLFPFLGSLANNRLCGITPWGVGTYTTEGITKLCEGLKGSAVTSLECGPAPIAFLSAPIDTAPLPVCSLAVNQLCGVYHNGKVTYTTDGITKLCEGLKKSAVTSLKCAAPLSVRLSVNAH